MAPVKLEGPTLGHKHRSYNKILKESTANQTAAALQDIDCNEDDVINLFKVDTASANRNLDYILVILKGNDMLYVSRALPRSLWLITDNTYAHIINPEYLHSHLLPNMMTKAANKLMLHIRLHLRDEKRVEEFFNYYEPYDFKTALKWLPHCSAAFIEVQVKKYANDIDSNLLKRLCEKSHRVLKTYVESVGTNNWHIRKGFQATMFLLNSHRDFYLSVVEACKSTDFPVFKAKYSKLILKACPERIQQNFRKYANGIHLPTFVKFLDKNKVKEFLLKEANIEQPNQDSWINFDKVQYFLRRMPQEERVNFIKHVFVNKCGKKVNKDEESETESSSEEMDVDDTNNDENPGMIQLYKYVCRNSYNNTSELLSWYKCLPFDVVLTEFKEKIKSTKNEYDRCHMFERITRVVHHDTKNLENLLQYYNDCHLKDSLDNKVEFVHNLFYRPTNILSYDSKCWGLLMNIFNAIKLNVEESNGDDKKRRKMISYNDDQIMLRAIIVHEIINKKEVSEKVTENFDFYTFKEYKKKMAMQDQKLLLDYLYNYLLKKIEKQNFGDHTVFNENVNLIKLTLRLLNDWQQNLADYPYISTKINELIKTKRDNAIKANLSWIYDVNKNWRKCMFEESIILCESDRVCVNALKHDPSLLSRNEDVITSMRCNDAISLRHLLIKLKVYWADSIASEWSQSYRERLTQPLGYKALVQGLCFLLPQEELSAIISKYKPEDAIINWETDNEDLISLRKHIAKNMHFARPQPTPDEVLQYAKGDYLQFALPSLSAILYNLSRVRCSELIPKLLNSPVSLQKHGIRCAFAKIESENLQRIFSEHWKTIKNLSIRAVLFKLTYELLCKEKNPDKIENIWGLLTMFINALSFEEDKTIYELLGKVEKVPSSVRPAYVMKSYTFLKTLLPKSDLDKSKYEQNLNALIHHMDKLIESMESEFITEIFNDYFAAVYTKDKADVFVHNDLMPLLGSFLCCSESIEIQAQRYEDVLLPLLNHTVTVWPKKDKNDIAKSNLKRLLKILREKLQPLVEKNKIVPVAMFAEIQKVLEQSLDHDVAYLTLTEWKLTAAFARLLNDNQNKVDRCKYDEDSNLWKAICKEIAPQFGKMCLDYLKTDIQSFFPTIDEYFTKALGVVFDNLINTEIQIEVLKHMLMEELTQSYLVTIRILPVYYGGCTEGPLLEFYETILSHPSLEVKMHFYYKHKYYRRKNLLLA